MRIESRVHEVRVARVVSVSAQRNATWENPDSALEALRHIGSLFVPRYQLQMSRRIRDLACSRFECQGSVLLQLMAINTIFRKHCSCCSRVQSDSLPAQTVVVWNSMCLRG